MTGYKTIIAQIIGLAASMAVIWGIDIDSETQAEITTGVVALWGVVNVILRAVTKTAMFKSE